MVKYAYDAFGNCKVLLDTAGLSTVNSIRYRSYYYDHETGMYYLGSRYYNPQWRRFISPSTSAINPSAVNGLNGYAFAGNNPVKYIENNIREKTTVSSVISMSQATNFSSKSNLNILHSSLASSKTNKFSLFGYELRTSAGWESTPYILIGPIGKFGYSSYTTTTNVMNWLGTTYYAGIGINVFDVIGVEIQLELLGAGAQASIGNFSLSINANIIGETSITFGYDTDLGNGITRTDGFTIGFNTRLLVAVAIGVFIFVTTGDPSKIPFPGSTRPLPTPA